MDQSNPVAPARRAALALTAFVGVYLLTAVPALVLFGGRGSALLVSLLAAVAMATYVWIHADDTQSYARNVLLGVVVFGGLGFAAGFFGALIFAPGANQGPLLGIFITGPVGILIGAVYGLAKSWRQNDRRRAGQG